MSDEPDLPAKAPAPYVNDRVHLRAPAGTDLRAAMAEAFHVFNERTDGTTDTPWWTLTRWWHGGPFGLHRGVSEQGGMSGLLLPPSETGVIPGIDESDREAVYITSDRADALTFAARHNRPTLYQVTVDVEPIFDDVLPQVLTSKRVPRATIVRVEQPSRLELAAVLRRMMGG